MPNAYIAGTGGYVPPRVVTNRDLVERYGIETDDAWIVKRTGIRERRFADEGVSTTDLGLEAARRALEAAGTAPHELDMILFATLSPDHAFPGCGVFLQERLGLCEGPQARFVPAMDIRNQCSGFLYALGAADGMIRSGACRNVLVVGAEKHSPALDLTTRGRTVASLFGDGAGAVVLRATDQDRGVRAWRLGADGRGAEVLCQKVWDIRGRTFIPLDDEGRGVVEPEMLWAQMDGRQVFRNAVERMAEALVGLCREQGVDLADIDLFAFHQANLRINQYVAQALSIPEERLLTNIDRYGNTTAATIPLLLDEAVRTGRLAPGARVALVAFGSGFTWGAALVDW